MMSPVNFRLWRHSASAIFGKAVVLSMRTNLPCYWGSFAIKSFGKLWTKSPRHFWIYKTSEDNGEFRFFVMKRIDFVRNRVGFLSPIQCRGNRVILFLENIARWSCVLLSFRWDILFQNGLISLSDNLVNWLVCLYCLYGVGSDLQGREVTRAWWDCNLQAGCRDLGSIFDSSAVSQSLTHLHDHSMLLVMLMTGID